MASFVELSADGTVTAVVADGEVALSKSASDVQGTLTSDGCIGELLDGSPVAVGMVYDGKRFIPPQPFKSWVWDEKSFSWLPPKPAPQDKCLYRWDEEKGDWQNVSK